MAEGLSFSMTPAYEVLLIGSPSAPLGLYHLHLATSEQLHRPHYAKGSLKATQAKLKVLEDHGYVLHDAIPSKQGKSPFYYVLGPVGVEYLRALGYDVSESFRVQKEVDKSLMHITHTLELNDVIIAAVQLKQANEEFYLHQFFHERDLKRSPYKAIFKSWGCEPDAFLDFRQSNVGSTRRRLPVFLEHDRGTELGVKFREKIRAYITVLKSGLYKELFGLTTITVAFTVFDNPKRLQDIRRWTREELESSYEELNTGRRFVFTNQPKPPDAEHIWLEPCWQTPYDEPFIALVVT